MLTKIFGEAAPKDPGALLNNALTVDRIVREFFAFVLRGMHGPDFMNHLEFECARLNGLFLGSGPADGFERTDWNTPDRAGEYVLAALNLDGETRKAVETAFMVYASRLLSIGEAGAHREDHVWQAQVDKLVRELVAALLGVPA